MSAYPGRMSYSATYEKACNVLFAVDVLGWSQTQAAIYIGLNVGTVNHIVHGRRFPSAIPIPFHDVM